MRSASPIPSCSSKAERPADNRKTAERYRARRPISLPIKNMKTTAELSEIKSRSIAEKPAKAWRRVLIHLVSITRWLQPFKGKSREVQETYLQR